MLKCVNGLQINPAFIISVSGIFMGAMYVNAPNGELHFRQALHKYAGHYNLTVFTSNGTDTVTYVLIVYGEFRKFIKKFSYTLNRKVFIGFTVKKITN